MNDKKTVLDPLLKMEATVQVVQPFQALKRYQCPGCHHDIEARVGHVVVVPVEAPDLRRHWHKPCWNQKMKLRK